jgi:hypothetical protein
MEFDHKCSLENDFSIFIRPIDNCYSEDPSEHIDCITDNLTVLQFLKPSCKREKSFFGLSARYYGLSMSKKNLSQIGKEEEPSDLDNYKYISLSPKNGREKIKISHAVRFKRDEMKNKVKDLKKKYTDMLSLTEF